MWVAASLTNIDGSMSIVDIYIPTIWLDINTLHNNRLEIIVPVLTTRHRPAPPSHYGGVWRRSTENKKPAGWAWGRALLSLHTERYQLFKKIHLISHRMAAFRIHNSSYHNRWVILLILNQLLALNRVNGDDKSRSPSFKIFTKILTSQWFYSGVENV